MRPVYTVGHSAQSEQEFLARCRSVGINSIVDIRSHPISRWSHFNREEMEGEESWIRRAGIEYRWEPNLGGWSGDGLDETIVVSPRTNAPFPPTKGPGAYTGKHCSVRDWAQLHGVEIELYGGASFPRNHSAKQPVGDMVGKWQNQGQVDYCWYTALPTFRTAIRELVSYVRWGSSTGGVGLMCTEFVWWKCHRAQVADVLGWNGIPVTHIQPSHVNHTDMMGRRLRNYPDLVKSTWGPRQKMRRGH